MNATLEVWKGKLQTYEEGSFFTIKPTDRLVAPTQMNCLHDVDQWLATLRSTYSFIPAQQLGDELVVVIVKLHNIASRSSYTCAYLDDMQADDLRWSTLGGFVIHPDFADLPEHHSHWIEVQSLECDTLMVMLG